MNGIDNVENIIYEIINDMTEKFNNFNYQPYIIIDRYSFECDPENIFRNSSYEKVIIENEQKERDLCLGQISVNKPIKKIKEMFTDF